MEGRYPTTGTCPPACLKHNLHWHAQWNKVTDPQLLHPSEYTTLCTWAVQSCTMQPCISPGHPLHLFNLVSWGWRSMPPRERKTEVGELGCDDLFKPLHREDWANVWRHLVDILIPFVEPLNMFTETDDLWVKVIHTEMEFGYEIPTITCRSFALLCNSHNVTFTFKQISYFLGPRFWKYQMFTHVQPYTSDHKGLLNKN